MKTVAEYIMDYLYAKGIRTVFMVPGGGSIKMCTALFESKLQTIEQHDEQACGFAAEASARYSGLLSVVMVTSGPGATNAFTAVAEAYFNSAPVLFLSGQVTINQTTGFQKHPNIRQIGVQEINIVPSIAPITKYAAMVKNPTDIRKHLNRATAAAISDRPGPVWLDIPVDVQGALIEESSLPADETTEADSYAANAADVQYVATLLKCAERPVVLIGQGVRNAGAGALAEELIVKYDLPVVSSYLGLDIIGRDLKNNMRNIGFKGCRYGNITVQDSDVLLVLGSRLSIATVGYNSRTFARAAKIIVVDIDRMEHSKDTVQLDRFIHCDVREFLSALLPALEQTGMKPCSDWLRRCIAIKEKYPVCQESFREDLPGGLNPYHLIDHITSASPAELPLVADTGTALFVASQGANLKKGQRYIPSGFATMGYSLPAAIGISVTRNKGPVIALSGDGSVQMNLQELQTVVHNKLPLKLFILNNHGYYTMKPPIQRGYNAEGVYAAIKAHISFPDFEGLANAYGIKYVVLANQQDLREKVTTDVLCAPNPILFDAQIDENTEVYTLTTFHQKDGSIVSRPIEDLFPYLDREELYGMMHISGIE